MRDSTDLGRSLTLLLGLDESRGLAAKLSDSVRLARPGVVLT